MRGCKLWRQNSNSGTNFIKLFSPSFILRRDKLERFLPPFPPSLIFLNRARGDLTRHSQVLPVINALAYFSKGRATTEKSFITLAKVFRILPELRVEEFVAGYSRREAVQLRHQDVQPDPRVHQARPLPHARLRIRREILCGSFPRFGTFFSPWNLSIPKLHRPKHEASSLYIYIYIYILVLFRRSSSRTVSLQWSGYQRTRPRLQSGKPSLWTGSPSLFR
jgi:hypothetical protein